MKRQQVVEKGLPCFRAGGGAATAWRLVAGGAAGAVEGCGGAAAAGRLVAERHGVLARLWRSQAGWRQQRQQESEEGWWQYVVARQEIETRAKAAVFERPSGL